MRVASGERQFGRMGGIIKGRVVERWGEAVSRHAGVRHWNVSTMDCGEIRVAGCAVRRAVVRPAESSAPIEGTELKACGDAYDDGVETGGANLRRAG